MGGVAQRGVEEEGKRGLERFIRAVGSVTDMGFFSLERGHYRENGGGHVAGPCHRAYWQSVSKAASRRENKGFRDRRVPGRK